MGGHESTLCEARHRRPVHPFQNTWLPRIQDKANVTTPQWWSMVPSPLFTSWWELHRDSLDTVYFQIEWFFDQCFFLTWKLKLRKCQFLKKETFTRFMREKAATPSVSVKNFCHWQVSIWRPSSTHITNSVSDCWPKMFPTDSPQSDLAMFMLEGTATDSSQFDGLEVAKKV